MEELEKVRRAFQEMAGKFGPSVFLEAKIISVDEGNFTADLETDEGLVLYDCRLRALPGNSKSVEVRPQVGSRVLVCKLDETEFYVMACDRIESYRITAGDTVFDLTTEGITINGGSLGGLVKVKELQKQLDKTNAVVQAIVDAFILPFPQGWQPVASDGGAALKVLMGSVLAGKEVGSFEDIENDKVKQG